MKEIFSNITKHRIIWFYGLLSASFVYITLYFLNSVNPDLLLSYFLTLMIFLISFGVIFFQIIRHKRLDIFEAIYWSIAYFLLIFGIYTLYAFLYGARYLGRPSYFDVHTLYSFNLALLYIILGLFSFLIGYYSNFGIVVSNILPSLPKSWSENKAKKMIPILLLAGLVAHSWLIIKEFGGFSYYLLHKQYILQSKIAGTYYITLGASLVTYSFYIAYIFWLKSGLFPLLTWIFLFPLNLILTFITGSKASFLSLFFVMVVLFHYIKKRLSLRRILLLIFFSLLFFPIFNVYRGDYENISDLIEHVKIQAMQINKNKELLLRHLFGRFTSLDNVTIIIRDTPDVMNFQFGKTILPAFIAIIPRKLWEEKPVISFGKIFSALYLGYENPPDAPSEAVSIIGDGYINFHIPGILLFSFILGVLNRILYCYCIRRNFGHSGIFLYAIILEGLFRIWEWSIGGAITKFIPIIFVVVVLSYLLRQSKVKNEATFH